MRATIKNFFEKTENRTNETKKLKDLLTQGGKEQKS